MVLLLLLLLQVSEGLHYLAHALHALSDLMVDFGAAPSREVRARPYAFHQTTQLSASIPNVTFSIDSVQVPDPSMMGLAVKRKRSLSDDPLWLNR